MVMNLNHPDDDIDLEIKKMNFIEYLISETMSTEYLIEEFGSSLFDSNEKALKD